MDGEIQSHSGRSYFWLEWKIGPFFHPPAYRGHADWRSRSPEIFGLYSRRNKTRNEKITLKIQVFFWSWNIYFLTSCSARYEKKLPLNLQLVFLIKYINIFNLTFLPPSNWNFRRIDRLPHPTHERYPINHVRNFCNLSQYETGNFTKIYYSEKEMSRIF